MLGRLASGEVIDKQDKCIRVFRVKGEKLFWVISPPQINLKYAPLVRI